MEHILDILLPPHKQQLDAAHGGTKDLSLDKTAKVLVPVLLLMSGVTTCNSLPPQAQTHLSAHSG